MTALIVLYLFLDTNRGQVSSRQKSGSSGVGKLTKPRGSVFQVCARCGAVMGAGFDGWGHVVALWLWRSTGGW